VRAIDLNADLGEEAGSDDELLQLVTSASVACGAHAGSEQTIRAVVRRAGEVGVAVGAHPGYPDREGFGRRELGATAADIERWVRLQLETFVDICGNEGVPVRYVKAHGALYNRAVHDAAAAAAFVGAVAATHRELAVLALPASQMLAAARAAGMRSRPRSVPRPRLPGGRFTRAA
jgi:5-oxoprolinase (ATP-hydrolysing) subunit A